MHKKVDCSGLLYFTMPICYSNEILRALIPSAHPMYGEIDAEATFVGTLILRDGTEPILFVVSDIMSYLGAVGFKAMNPTREIAIATVEMPHADKAHSKPLVEYFPDGTIKPFNPENVEYAIRYPHSVIKSTEYAPELVEIAKLVISGIDAAPMKTLAEITADQSLDVGLWIDRANGQGGLEIGGKTAFKAKADTPEMILALLVRQHTMYHAN